MFTLWKDPAKVNLYCPGWIPTAMTCSQRLPLSVMVLSVMVLHTLLGPRVRFFATEKALESANGPRRTPVPTMVLSGSSTPSIWYSAFDTILVGCLSSTTARMISGHIRTPRLSEVLATIESPSLRRGIISNNSRAIHGRVCMFGYYDNLSFRRYIWMSATPLTNYLHHIC